jgi:hypothetical protein
MARSKSKRAGTLGILRFDKRPAKRDLRSASVLAPVPGVLDQGGYSLVGPRAMTCPTGLKFRAASDVLTAKADAPAGFVLDLGQTGSVDVRARQVPEP